MSARSGDQLVVAAQGQMERLDGGPRNGTSFGREFVGRVVLPLLALASVICIWWVLYLIYPRLLPSPLGSHFRNAVRHQ